MLRALLLLIAATGGSTDGLKSRIEQISRAVPGHVGAAVLLLETGESVEFHGDDQFPMQSVYKLPIGMAVLEEVDRGVMRLDQQVRVEKDDLVPPGVLSTIRDEHPGGGVEMSVRELLRRMVADSDGTASDVLLRLAGGPEPVNRYLRSLGVEGIVVAASEKEMAREEHVQYRNWATPRAIVVLLCGLEESRGLTAPSRALLLQWMTETTRAPNRIKGLLPAGTIVAHKPGTSDTSHGLTRATNDAGLVTLPDGRHLAVAVFVSDSRASEARDSAR